MCPAAAAASDAKYLPYAATALIAAAAASDARYLLDAAAALAAAAAYRAMYNPIITIFTVLGLVGGAPGV